MQETRLRAVVDSWPIPRGRVPPSHTAVIVVARRGYCVFGPADGGWLNAWRYGNFLVPIYPTELMLVTEYGWQDFTTAHAGLTPCLATKGEEAKE